MMTIIRGEDRTAPLKIRYKKDQEPYPLTGWTKITVIFEKSDRSKLEKTSGQKPAVKASASYGGVTYTAVTAGPNGNDIELVFNGTDSITTVVNAWNTANPSNTVSHNSSTPSSVPTAGSVKLFGGKSAYYDIEIVNLDAGKFTVHLSETDTKSLKVGPKQSFQVIIDKGDNTQGNRRIAVFDALLTVQDA
jgi:hypothetical protein